jgi:integrase
MPRKPKFEKTQITVVVRGTPVSVTLYPPIPPRTSWYAYWAGLAFAKSTGKCDLKSAIGVAENMVRNGGERLNLDDTVLSDAEFDEIQRRHFGKRKDPAAQVRAQKSLTACLEAISAFRLITGISPITLATPKDCERFQEAALKKPRDWRMSHPRKDRDSVARIRPNTVIKWSVALQAAFERACRNAGKKCVRGVVDEGKLLSSNPWRNFTWIAGTAPKKRHLSDEELLSILDYLEGRWPTVTTGVLFAKTSLWMWARRAEVASLRWDDLRIVGNEYHFDFIGKWGIRKWARIPAGLYRELSAVRTDSPYVFAAYTEQLREHYQGTPHPLMAKIVGPDFDPELLYRWFHTKIRKWADVTGRERASHHSFRKTALQTARCGDDRNEQVAQDAKVTEAVMLRHYVDETDEELRQASNRTYGRLVAGLSPKVSERYGYRAEEEGASLEDRLKAAVAAKDWPLAKELLDRLSS